MKERGMLFSGPMVRAILDGSKTQTRRAIKPQPEQIDGHVIEWCHPRSGCIAAETTTELLWHCPCGQEGDRLWVKETWQEVHPVRAEGRYSQEGYAGIPGPPGVKYRVVYRADGNPVPALYHMSDYPYRTCDPSKANLAGVAREEGWAPSIHMPRWASRLTLEITGVRVERLQDITEEDAEAEGMAAWAAAYCSKRPEDELYARAYFELAWNQINGKKHPWSSNPWVWVITFRRV